MPFLLVIVALILLVVLHELGHFLAARMVGIRATKFYVFFPPALFKRQVGDVEYGIGAIPAGGFVKLPGMFEPEPGDVAERLRLDLDAVLPIVDGDVRLRLDAARRSIAHADGPDGMLEPLGDIHDGLRHALEAEQRDEQRSILATAEDRVVGMLDDSHPKAYWRASLWRRMAVIFAGPLANLVIAFVVLTAFWWGLSPRYEVSEPLQVAKVEANSPAERAGLDEDSKILDWNGPVVGSEVFDLRDRIAAGIGKPIELTWRDEDGTKTTRTIEPARIGDERVERIGVLLPADGSSKALAVERTGREVTSLGTGTRIALIEMREITWGNLSRLPRVFFDAEIRKDVGSVVGIVQVADDVDRAGQFVRYVAIISLILAVMNLLPLLPLDGGHLLFGILEALRRGRPMPRAAFERYSLVGMAIVLMLFFIGLDNDIARARG